MFSVVSQASFENVKDKKLKAKKDIVILDIQVFICNKTIKPFTDAKYSENSSQSMNSSKS